MTSTGLSVEIVRCDDLILDTLVIHLNRMVRVVATENEKVLYSELFCLTPPNLKTSLLCFIVFVL